MLSSPVKGDMPVDEDIVVVAEEGLTTAARVPREGDNAELAPAAALVDADVERKRPPPPPPMFMLTSANAAAP
jgi:hypothetical protein